MMWCLVFGHAIWFDRIYTWYMMLIDVRIFQYMHACLYIYIYASIDKAPDAELPDANNKRGPPESTKTTPVKSQVPTKRRVKAPSIPFSWLGHVICMSYFVLDEHQLKLDFQNCRHGYISSPIEVSTWCLYSCTNLMSKWIGSIYTCN